MLLKHIRYAASVPLVQEIEQKINLYEKLEQEYLAIIDQLGSVQAFNISHFIDFGDSLIGKLNRDREDLLIKSRNMSEKFQQEQLFLQHYLQSQDDITKNFLEGFQKFFNPDSKGPYDCFYDFFCKKFSNKDELNLYLRSDCFHAIIILSTSYLYFESIEFSLTDFSTILSMLKVKEEQLRFGEYFSRGLEENFHIEGEDILNPRLFELFKEFNKNKIFKTMIDEERFSNSDVIKGFARFLLNNEKYFRGLPQNVLYFIQQCRISSNFRHDYTSIASIMPALRFFIEKNEYILQASKQSQKKVTEIREKVSSLKSILASLSESSEVVRVIEQLSKVSPVDRFKVSKLLYYPQFGVKFMGDHNHPVFYDHVPSYGYLFR
ncbi:MAG: hypothetical protein LBJ09_02265 [Clostridiales bacterium]|jgi:hypothetical protein|nr:hypothetical protein [Clostridiales bacterium]